jgi:hypothetical protein
MPPALWDPPWQNFAEACDVDTVIGEMKRGVAVPDPNHRGPIYNAMLGWPEEPVPAEAAQFIREHGQSGRCP